MIGPRRPVTGWSSGEGRCRVCQLVKRPNDLLWAVWLWQEASTLGKVIQPNIHKPRSGYYLDGRPTPPDGRRQFQTVHRTGHLDVCEDDANVRSLCGTIAHSKPLAQVWS